MPALMWLAVASAALAMDLPAGQVIDRVTCTADSSQSYALFLPASYTPSRTWPVIFAFDPGGRGLNPVERYRVAAERYGFIVVGSNNSRNGSSEIATILAAMTADVTARFAVDSKRVYLAGMSGGARVAFGIALASKGIAGVMASSAGYPDSQVRKSLAFPVFATAGTEDFNHLELRTLDRALTTPHHLTIFDGGHVWLSSELAVEAVEWMEVQAMKTGLKPRDEAEIDRLFAARQAAADRDKTGKATMLALQGLVDDFRGLRDVSAPAARLAELARDKSIQAAIRKDRDDDERERNILRQIASLEARLASDDRIRALAELRQRWKDLSIQATLPDDSSNRQQARRVLSALSADAASTRDAEYLKIIAEYRIRRGGPQPR